VTRILAILMACLFMVAVMVVLAAPAFATVKDAGPFKRKVEQHKFVGHNKPGR
jgi:hypothetical protein